MKLRALRAFSGFGKEHHIGDIISLDDEYLNRVAKNMEQAGTAVIIPPEKAQIVGQEEKSLTITARELMKRKKNTDYIVSDFLLPKTVNMLYSPPGSYKSLLVLDACLSIAVGEPWLDLKTKQGKVLILDNENSESELRNRLVALVNGHGWLKKKRLAELNLVIRKGNLENPGFLEWLCDYVKENGVRLVVFDTVRRFGGFDENSSTDINALYMKFQQIINGNNTSILFLHHSRKEGGTYRGSVDLLGQVDSAYQLEKRKNSNEFSLVCEKSRSGEIEEISGTIEWDKENEITKITRIDATEAADKADKYAKFREARVWVLGEIAKAVPMAGETFKRSLLTGALDGFNADVEEEKRIKTRTLERVLKHLVSTKYLSKTGKLGEYRRLFSHKDYGFRPQEEVNEE